MTKRAAKETVVEATIRLGQDQAVRAADMAKDSVKICMRPPSPDAMTDGFKLAAATYQRSVALQASWIKDWANWIDFAQSIQGADTVPKYFDRINNIFLQAEAQLASQASEYSELADNVGVSYAYWLSQHVQDKD